MTKTFDELCSEFLGEDYMSATKPQAQQAQTNPSQKPGVPQPTPAAPQQNQQQTNDDQELLQLLQQKLADEKFKQSLLQLLNTKTQ